MQLSLQPWPELPRVGIAAPGKPIQQALRSCPHSTDEASDTYVCNEELEQLVHCQKSNKRVQKSIRYQVCDNLLHFVQTCNMEQRTNENVAIHQTIQSNYTITMAKNNCAVQFNSRHLYTAKIITYMRGASVS
jgi:hypothetical protein